MSPDCGTRAQFEESIVARIGSEAGALLESTTLEMRATKAGYMLTVRVGDQVRELTDRSCQDLFRAGVVVAVAFFNGTGTEPTPPGTDGTTQPAAITPPSPAGSTSPSAPSGSTPPTPQKLETNTAASTAPKPEPRPIPSPHSATPVVRETGHYYLSLDLGLLVGRVPETRPALGLSASYEGSRFGLQLDTRFVPSSEVRDSENHGVRAYALGGALAAMYKLVPNFGVELGAFAYRLTGHGVGVTTSATSSVVAVGPQAGVWWTPWESGAWLARLTGNVEFNLLRSRFELDDSTNVFSSSRVAFLGGLAVGRKF